MIPILGTPRYTPSDLIDFIACDHLAAFEREVERGTLTPPARSPEELLLFRKGNEHERSWLNMLADRGLDVVEIPRPIAGDGYLMAAERTVAAMVAGAAIVHGATFVTRDWVGIADFLERVEDPSNFGGWSYEIADAKLARDVSPSVAIGLCLHAQGVAEVQGHDPLRVHAILGDGTRRTLRYADLSAYVRELARTFLDAQTPTAATYPEPRTHCGRCRWDAVCTAKRRADDHPSVVAGASRSQVAKLQEAGITTMRALAHAPDAARPPRIAAATYEKLRAQAALQHRARETGRREYEVLPPQPALGFGALPVPDVGDCWFDMEGDPYVEGRGLEYLFGVVTADTGRPAFRAFWAHDRDAERTAFAAFVDFVFERRRRFPMLHVYHYASYEVTALKTLAARHRTREAEVDTLLRDLVFVDLYAVVRHAIRISEPSYSLKSVERFYREKRAADVTTAMGSVIEYERWRETRDPAILDAIAAYNFDDCDSTRELHRWLCDVRREAEAQTQVPWRETVEPAAPSEKRRTIDERIHALEAELSLIGTPEAILTGDLLEYHRWEARPEWWAYFQRLKGMALDELIEDGEALAGIAPLPIEPVLEKKSLVHAFTYPPQDFKLRVGDKPDDPASQKQAGQIMAIDREQRIVHVSRGPSLRDVALPRALVGNRPLSDHDQRDSIERYARAFLAGDEGYAAVRAIVARDAPLLTSRDRAIDSGAMSGISVAARALELDRSYLFVQGPPGSGKTTAAAQTIIALLQAKRRVGVMARSHQAVHHLLRAVERVAARGNVAFHGMYKASSQDPDSVYASLHGFITSTVDASAIGDAAHLDLIAGTPWLFSRESLDRRLDHLIVDEAGQIALADLVACGTAAENIVLFGDPRQLPQVAKGLHPEDAGRSVLEHLLGGESTVAPERGIFLERSYRMHPAICSFVSNVVYGGRLVAAAPCERQRIVADTPLAGFGLRYLPVVHRENSRSSPEEADAIVNAVRELQCATVVDCEGEASPLRPSDMLVVTPYNAQVECIRSAFTAAGMAVPRVGTVDKFQGQEAPIVFFSLATSDGDEIPRDVAFLFSRHRLNVALSRARTLAILVSSPALLAIECRSVEQMELVNLLCRFVETATVHQPEVPRVFAGTMA